MPDLEERFSAALHATARAWRAAVDRRLKGQGLSQASWLTLAVAAKSRVSLSQSELADGVGVEGATMVAMLDRLVKAGLVAREISTSDRRVKYVRLTETGNRLYEKVKAVAADLRKELLSNLDPQQIALATDLLETIQQRIEQGP